MTLQTCMTRDAEAAFACLVTAIGDGPLAEPMRYAVHGGKGLRAFLVMESARLHDIAPARAVYPAAAIEALHGYSLVHDDLPSMDDDQLRRGRPTVHIAWDEATAVLVGDGLQSIAFELAGAEPVGNAAVRADLVTSLARDALRMVRGQALDIAAESASDPLTLDEITQLQAGKTGALIRWSAQAGARMAEANLTPWTHYAERLGLAFQIADDILDVTGDAAAMGKAVGKDEDRGKATFVSLLGLDGAKRRAETLVTEAAECLSDYGARANNLRDLARFVISRQS